MMVYGQKVFDVIEDIGDFRVDPHHAIALGWDCDGVIISACAFNNWVHDDIEGHIVHRRGHMMTPAFIVSILDYAFHTANVDRVTARVWADKHRNHRFAKHLGFVKEGELKFFNRPNLIIYGLYREQAIARWLTDSYLRHKGVHDGKRITVTPACA